MKYKKAKLKDIIFFNPKETIKKNQLAKKIPMDALIPFTRKVGYYEVKEFNSGTKFRNNDTLMARITPCLENGKTAYINILDEDEIAFGSTEYFVLRADENYILPKYLYYISISDELRNTVIKSMTGTSGRQRAQKESVLDFEIELPSISIQKKVLSILDSIDSKIEVNNQIISNLEELASTLFKRWFVDFEFPDEKGNPYKSSGGKMVDSELGEIPEYFQVKKLSDIADVIGGGTPSKKVKEYFEDGNISWITPKDLSINKNIFIDRGKTSITRLGLDKSSAKLLPKNSILFSSRAPIGYTAISKNELATNQGFKSLIALDGIPYQFIFHFIRNNVSKFESIATGSTFKEVSGTAVKNFKIVLPTEEVLQNYADVTSPLFKKIKIVEEENTILTELRDSLLPKLLSGEIELTEDEGV
ncbi:TPA: restriction endonuclease subunit S [Enterococcus hirae]